MKKAILFDLDGTLLDSIPFIGLSFEHTFNHLGLPWNEEEVLNTIGLPLRDVAKHYADQDHEEFLAVFAEFQVKNQERLLKPFPEAKRTLNQILQKGYHTGIVTSKRRKATRESLALTGLDRYLDVVVAVEDTSKPKPNPDSVLWALEQLKTSPEKGVYIGDSIFDIMTGKNAGVATIGVTWGIAARDALEEQQPDFLVDSWQELHLAINTLCQG